MGHEGIMRVKYVRQRQISTVLFHLYVESKTQNKAKLTFAENRVVAARRRGRGVGKTREEGQEVQTSCLNINAIRCNVQHGALLYFSQKNCICVAIW